MKKRIFILLVLAMVFALSFGAVMAQEAPFTLRISRDWGYGNGADINGRMSLSVKGDQDKIQQVTFFIDDEVMASVAAAPFKFQFDTNNFEPGLHRLTAEVKTTTGETYTTNGLVSNFVEKGEANQSMLKILLLVGGIVAASMGIQFFMQKMRIRTQNTTKMVAYNTAFGAARSVRAVGSPLIAPFLGSISWVPAWSVARIAVSWWLPDAPRLISSRLPNADPARRLRSKPLARLKLRKRRTATTIASIRIFRIFSSL